MKRLHETGPFDIIGDLHGCADELEQLLGRLGYECVEPATGPLLAEGPLYRHPEGRKAIFLGDLVDRGPRILDCLRIVYRMVRAEQAICVAGNHDDKFRRKLMGRNVSVTHGLEDTLAQLDALPEAERLVFSEEALNFLETLPHHMILDEGRLVIAHAGLKEELHGARTERMKAFALYGETTGEKDEYGLPIRGNWPARYRGKALVVYGHTPVPEPLWQNNTVDLDTGCVFGGYLTALRYPENETVRVPAREIYYESARPFPRAQEDTAEKAQPV